MADPLPSRPAVGAPSSPSTATERGAAGGHPHPPQLKSGPWLLLLFALVAGTLSWLSIQKHFRYADALPSDLQGAVHRIQADYTAAMRSDETRRAWINEERVIRDEVFTYWWKSQIRNSLLAGGLFGLITGGLFGLCEGISNWSFRRLAIGLGAGGLIGGAVGCIAGLAGLYTLHGLSDTGISDLGRTILVHAALWSIGGLGVGIALGLHGGFSVLWRSSTGSMLGGVTAAIVYCPLAALLFPMETTVPLVPTGDENRLVWLFLATLCMVSCAELMFPQYHRTPANPPPTLDA